MGNCQLGWPVPDGLSHRRGWHFGQQAARVLVQLLTGVVMGSVQTLHLLCISLTAASAGDKKDAIRED